MKSNCNGIRELASVNISTLDFSIDFIKPISMVRMNVIRIEGEGNKNINFFPYYSDTKHQSIVLANVSI